MLTPLRERPERLGVLDRGGQQGGACADGQYLLHACPASQPGPKQLAAAGGTTGGRAGTAQFEACINKLSATLHTVVTYQPASRFWPFQWAEMGIFLAAALALCGLTYWWLRRQYA